MNKSEMLLGLEDHTIKGKKFLAAPCWSLFSGKFPRESRLQSYLFNDASTKDIQIIFGRNIPRWLHFDQPLYIVVWWIESKTNSLTVLRPYKIGVTKNAFWSFNSSRYVA